MKENPNAVGGDRAELPPPNTSQAIETAAGGAVDSEATRGAEAFAASPAAPGAGAADQAVFSEPAPTITTRGAAAERTVGAEMRQTTLRSFIVGGMAGLAAL